MHSLCTLNKRVKNRVGAFEIILVSNKRIVQISGLTSQESKGKKEKIENCLLNAHQIVLTKHI